LGLIFLALNIAGILQLIPPPPDYPPAAMAFSGAMMSTGYLFWAVVIVEVLGGLALVLNLWTPLALVLLAPVTVNILLFHIFLTPRILFTTALPGVLVFVLNFVLLWMYRGYYHGMLTRKAKLG
jgi:hypothetical protein